MKNTKISKDELKHKFKEYFKQQGYIEDLG